MLKPSAQQIIAAFNTLRKDANDSGYGGFISDARLQVMAVEIATAVINVPAEKPHST